MKVYVAGHRGMVGSAIVDRLRRKDVGLILVDSSDLDLTVQADVMDFFRDENPSFVYVAAAKVGGIVANNSYPADFLYRNMMIQMNLFEAARKFNVQRLLFLGSSCIYPREAPQPITESDLLKGPLEKTNEAYAIAKIAGVKACDYFYAQYGCDFRAVMPTNLYGPGDNYDVNNSHVIPGLIHKIYSAKSKGLKTLTLWGDGSPRREFLHVSDLAKACETVMNLERNQYNKILMNDGHLNIGSGDEVSIAELANLICKHIGYDGVIEWDKSFPNGTPRKILDCTKTEKMGWSASISLREGLASVIEEFREQLESGQLPRGCHKQ